MKGKSRPVAVPNAPGVREKIIASGERIYRQYLPEVIEKLNVLIFESSDASKECTLFDVTLFHRDELQASSLRTIEGVRTSRALALKELRGSLAEDTSDRSTSLVARIDEELATLPDVSEVESTTIESCALVRDISEKAQILIVDTLEMLTGIKMWLQLRLPKFDEGSNYRAGIQEECVDECARTEEIGTMLLETLANKLCSERIDLLTKLLKHVDNADYRLALEAFDYSIYTTIKFSLLDLRNQLFLLYDFINRNYEKIKVPISSEAVAAMY